MRRILAIFSIIAVICGCHGNDADWLQELPESSEDIIQDIKWLDIPSDIIGIPSRMTVIGSKLILSDPKDGYALTCYDQSDGSVSKFLQIGRSDTEVVDVHQIFPHKGYLCVADIMTDKCLILDMNSYNVVGKYDLKEFSSVAFMDESIVGMLSNGDGRYGRKSLKSDAEIDSFGDYSEYGLSISSGSGLMQGDLLTDGLSRMAWFGYYTAVYQIVDMDKKSVLSSEILDMSSFNEHGHMYTTMRPESKVAFISVAGDSDGIFTLYDGKELSYYIRNAGSKPHGNVICQFDWDGTPISKYMSSQSITCLCVGDGKLYICAMAETGEYRVGYVEL